MKSRSLKLSIENLVKKIQRIGIHNITAPYILVLVVRSTEFLKTYHKDSLNVLFGVPTRMFAIDCLSRPVAGLPSVSGLIIAKYKTYDLSEPMKVTHPKHLDLITPKISGSSHVLILGPVFVDTRSGKLHIQNLFGPKTKTVEIYLGNTYNSYTYSGISMFLRIRKPKSVTGIFYSIQIREDQNYYHFLLLLAPAILRVYEWGRVNNVEIKFLLPKLSPKYIREFLAALHISTVTVNAKIIRLEKSVLTTIFSGDAPHPLDVKKINQYSLQISEDKKSNSEKLYSKNIRLGQLLYISRKNQSRFTALDEKIEHMLAEIGFLILTPEDYNIEEQMWFFSNSKFVIGNHGAGLANLVFCNKGTQIIELTVSEIQINDWMKSISQILELNYRYIEITKQSDILKLKEIVLDIVDKLYES